MTFPGPYEKPPTPVAHDKPPTQAEILDNSLDGALLKFQKDPPVLVRNKRGQAGAQITKYADMAQVNKRVLSRLNELGVIFVCKPTRLPDGAFVLDYRMTHVPTGETERGQYPLPTVDNSQRMGSAISYSRRYVLNALTGVAAEDDDDDGDQASRSAQRATGARSRPSASSSARSTQNTAQRSTEAADSDVGPDLPLLPNQRTAIVTLFGRSGIDDRTERLAITSEIVNRVLGSANELTRVEANRVITVLEGATKNEDPAAALRSAYLADDTVPPTTDTTSEGSS